MGRLDKVLKLLTLIVLTVLITFIVTSAYIYSNINMVQGLNSGTITPSTNTQSKFPLLESVYNLLNKSFYSDMDKEQLETQAIRGMLNGLNDPYSYHMNLEEFDSFNVDVLGTYNGVGLHLFYNVENNKIEVLTPIKNTPAYRTEIRPGDYIIAVNGTQYLGQQLQEAVKNIRGEVGKKVVLTVEREGKQFEVEIIRELINIEQLEYEVIEGNIGYINIATFDEDIDKDFGKAYSDLLSKNIKGMIIDLRDNPGGIFSEVIKMTDRLVPEGLVVYTLDKNNNRQDYESDAKSIKIPLVILTNESSASASEILAGAVQDHGVGTIVGTKTYGKGLVQKTFLLEDGSAIKLTVSEYFTPNGNKINGKGVIPDVEIEMSYDSPKDVQLQKAIEVLKMSIK